MKQDNMLQLIEDMLNSMDDDTFLNKYKAVELNVGPTIESFLTQHCFNHFVKTSFIKKYEEQYSCTSFEVRKIEATNNLYSVNDEVYFEHLAA